MAKKRTKKQKERALQRRNQIAEQIGSSSGGELVKREFIVQAKKSLGEARKVKNANTSAKDLDTSTIKRGIVKSLALASLILTLTTVIYFIWK